MPGSAAGSLLALTNSPPTSDNSTLGEQTIKKHWHVRFLQRYSCYLLVISRLQHPWKLNRRHRFRSRSPAFQQQLAALSACLPLSPFLLLAVSWPEFPATNSVFNVRRNRNVAAVLSYLVLFLLCIVEYSLDRTVSLHSLRCIGHLARRRFTKK